MSSYRLPKKKYLHRTMSSQFHGTNPRDATAASQRIERVLSASPLFVELKSGTEQGDYHYSFVLRSAVMPSEFIASMNGFISGVTFLVIPAYGRDIFIMTVVVKKGDYVLKTYNYRDHTDTWIQLVSSVPDAI